MHVFNRPVNYYFRIFFDLYKAGPVGAFNIIPAHGANFLFVLFESYVLGYLSTGTMSYLWVFLGGGIGSVVRFGAARFVSQYFGEWLPWSTIFINVTGSFAIGFFDTWTSAAGRWVAPLSVREFFMVGICGGYTTFSAFSLQTLALARTGEWSRAGANIVLSVVLCLIAVWLGHLVAISVNASK